MDAISTEKVVLLVVGWLLGLLGPAIVDAIRRHRENNIGRHAILSELRELGNTLALAAYVLRSDQGRVDKAFLEWLKTDIERQEASEELQNLVPHLRSLLDLPDEEFRRMVMAGMKKNSKATMLQRYGSPLLDARVAALWSFDTSFQRQLLEVKHHLALLDDLIDRSRKYFDLTFTKLDGDNHRLVQENLEQACSEYGRRAELVVVKIRSLQ